MHLLTLVHKDWFIVGMRVAGVGFCRYGSVLMNFMLCFASILFYDQWPGWWGMAHLFVLLQQQFHILSWLLGA